MKISVSAEHEEAPGACAMASDQNKELGTEEGQDTTTQLSDGGSWRTITDEMVQVHYIYMYIMI